MIYRDKHGHERTREQMRELTKLCLKGESKDFLIDIILYDLMDTDLLEYAMDDYGNWLDDESENLGAK